MAAIEWTRIYQILHDRREIIADNWHEAIAAHSFSPSSAIQSRRQFIELTEQFITLLCAEPFDCAPAQSIGSSLTRLHYTTPQSLGKTQQVLAHQIAESLPAEQAGMLLPRLTSLLGELATGFFQQARETILTEQEQIQGALFTALQTTEQALRKAHSQLEVRVKERTAELAETNEALRFEIVERKRAEQELRRRTAQLEVLRDIGLTITTQLDLDTLLNSIVVRAIELLDATSGGLYLYRPEQGVLEWVVSIEPSHAQIGLILHRGEGLSGKVWETGEPIVVDNYQCWEGRLPFWDEWDPMAIIGVPIHWGTSGTPDEFMGVLNILAESPRTFCADDAELLTLFATQAAIAIQNARLHEQTQRDAETKATLLREVNHRVRNNLSAIIGLLELENLRVEADNQAVYQNIIQDLTNRVQGLATVHRLLSVVEWSPLLLSDLASQIIDSALTALPADKYVSIDISPSPVRVAARYANNIALIVNELITNSIKHAWPDQNTGHIDVCIDLQEDDMVLFEFRDDGVGYPEEVLHLNRHSVGWGLIQVLIERSLRGEVTLRNDEGAVTTIRFPVPE